MQYRASRDRATPACEIARGIAANAPLAVCAALGVAREASIPTDMEARLRANDGMDQLRSADYREGPRAFLEKRPPVWTGR